MSRIISRNFFVLNYLRAQSLWENSFETYHLSDWKELYQWESVLAQSYVDSRNLAQTELHPHNFHATVIPYSAITLILPGKILKLWIAMYFNSKRCTLTVSVFCLKNSEKCKPHDEMGCYRMWSGENNKAPLLQCHFWTTANKASVVATVCLYFNAVLS